MMRIERLRLVLPAGYEHRAEELGRMVAEYLSQTRDIPNGRIDQLQVQHTLSGNTQDNRSLARSIARQVQQQMKQQQ